jgi:hypothetical protein
LSELQAVVVMDYQNVHLTGHDLFAADHGLPRHEALIALALVREAARSTTDLVILASRDSDLRPALDEALDLGRAKIETTTWHDPLRPGQCRPLQPDDEKRRLWNTRLSETEFQRSLDRRNYA